MLLSFQETVRALAETLVSQEWGHDVSPQISERVALYVLATHARMPDYLRVAFRFLTLLFDASSLLFRGKPFHRLSFAQRVAQIAWWERSFLQFAASFIAFHRTFTTFGFYSEVFGRDFVRRGRHDPD
ncbi:MAG: hypothetical protein HXY22_12250 [Alphaproteobacteria bacterium]|nr:hypothetical protein [Alphaproteobacteria bacterium]